jgi:hypothetical protein
MSFCSGVTAAPAHRPWRYLLAVAFVATIIGAFVPMVAIKYGRVTLGLTAMDLSFGMDKTRAVAEKELPKLPKVIGKRLESRLDSLRSDQTDLQLVLEASKWAMAAFIPGLLLGLLGGIAIARRKLGRVIGVLSIPLGLASIGAWFGLRFAMQYAAAEADLGKVEVALQLGAHALLVIGGLGLLAGLGALIKPDRVADAPELPPPPPPGVPRGVT